MSKDEYLEFITHQPYDAMGDFKKIIDLDFALNGAETAVDFTQALNLYLLSIGYIDEGNLEEYRQKVSRLS